MQETGAASAYLSSDPRFSILIPDSRSPMLPRRVGLPNLRRRRGRHNRFCPYSCQLRHVFSPTY